MLPEKLIINDVEYFLETHELTGQYEGVFVASYIDKNKQHPRVSVEFEDGIYDMYLLGIGESEDEAIDELTNYYLKMV